MVKKTEATLKTPVKKTTKAKKTTEVVAAPAPAPVVEAPVVEKKTSDANEVVSDTLVSEFGAFLGKIQAVTAQLSALRNEFRALEKKTVRELKAAKKLSSKKQRKNGNRAPSGFVVPTLISNDLASFLGKPSGTEMARTEVTREINKYIRAHDLQDKENGRKINANPELAKLLALGPSDQLTYFNLQKYMSPHFPKSQANKVAAAAAASASASA
jgi:upstream activation factor subunit UAF30